MISGIRRFSTLWHAICKFNIALQATLLSKKVYLALLISKSSIKMKKLNLIPAILMALSPLLINAQSPSGINQSMPIHSRSGGGQIINMSETKAATGSKYTAENFLPATVSGSEKSTVLVRYNAYDDSFEMNDGTRVLALPEQPGVNITLANTGDVYTLKSYKNEKGKDVTGYLSIVSDNAKVKIYKRERVYLVEGKPLDNGYSSAKPDAYKRADDEFYIQVNGGEIAYISGKKDVANMVPGKSKEVLDFIKKNKIDLEETQSLKQLGGYIETVL